MPFITHLRVAPIRGSDDRKLLSPLVYVDSELGAITVLTGFITNYASIPKIVPRWWLNSDDKYIREASVIHDSLYTKGSTLYAMPWLKRKDADLVFYRAMRELGCPWLKAKSAYYSVRMFGNSHWRSE